MEELGDAADGRRYSPSAARNRDDILPVLRRHLPATGRLLELAAGTGEHAIRFASELPNLHWQPTDRSETALASMRAWHEEAGLPNLAPPRSLEIESDDWPEGPWHAALAINLLHISPWRTTLALLAGVGRVLAPGGVFAVYGAFFVEEVATAPSNLQFDASLKARDPELGVRDFGSVTQAAAGHGLRFHERVSMPNNNYLGFWKREEKVGR